MSETDRPAGQPNAAVLKLAFWEALKRCGDDDRVHDMEYPWHDDPRIDGSIPSVLWEHMAVALDELRAAAGMP
jgi:hypothetical protein